MFDFINFFSKFSPALSLLGFLTRSASSGSHLLCVFLPRTRRLIIIIIILLRELKNLKHLFSIFFFYICLHSLIQNLSFLFQPNSSQLVVLSDRKKIIIKFKIAADNNIRYTKYFLSKNKIYTFFFVGDKKINFFYY